MDAWRSTISATGGADGVRLERILLPKSLRPNKAGGAVILDFLELAI